MRGQGHEYCGRVEMAIVVGDKEGGQFEADGGEDQRGLDRLPGEPARQAVCPAGKRLGRWRLRRLGEQRLDVGDGLRLEQAVLIDLYAVLIFEGRPSAPLRTSAGTPAGNSFCKNAYFLSTRMLISSAKNR